MEPTEANPSETSSSPDQQVHETIASEEQEQSENSKQDQCCKDIQIFQHCCDSCKKAHRSDFKDGQKDGAGKGYRDGKKAGLAARREDMAKLKPNSNVDCAFEEHQKGKAARGRWYEEYWKLEYDEEFRVAWFQVKDDEAFKAEVAKELEEGLADSTDDEEGWDEEEEGRDEEEDCESPEL